MLLRDFLHLRLHLVMVVATDWAKVLAVARVADLAVARVVVQVMVLVEDLVMDYRLLAPTSRQENHSQHILGFP